MFSRAENLFLTLLLSYNVWMTSKININFRYRRYLKVLMIVSYEFLKFSHYLCFRGWGIHFWYSYWATMFRWPRKSRSTSGATPPSLPQITPLHCFLGLVAPYLPISENLNVSYVTQYLWRRVETVVHVSFCSYLFFYSQWWKDWRMTDLFHCSGLNSF